MTEPKPWKPENPYYLSLQPGAAKHYSEGVADGQKALLKIMRDGGLAGTGVTKEHEDGRWFVIPWHEWEELLKEFDL